MNAVIAFLISSIPSTDTTTHPAPAQQLAMQNERNQHEREKKSY